MRTRQLYTKFWEDDFVQSLSMDKKAFFLFLLTNPNINQIGVYEISKTMMKFFTGLPLDTISTYLEELEQEGKVLRSGDWLAILNAWRYSNFNGPLNKTARANEWKRVPFQLKEKLSQIQPPQFMEFVTGGKKDERKKEAIDVEAIAQEYGVPVSHVKASLARFNRHHEARGTKLTKKLPAFKNWLERGMDMGVVKPSEDNVTWDQLDDFKKRQIMDAIEAGDFSKDWKPPTGTPQKWINKYNEMWPRAKGA